MNRGEIKMEGDERIASMCPLPGVPNTYLVMTTRSAMWRVKLTTFHGSNDQWEAKRITSKTESNAPHDSGML